jgi:hypothetical protein
MPHPLRRNATERLPVHVTFDQQRGYIASAEGLPIITALSLASLRRQIDARTVAPNIARIGEGCSPWLKLGWTSPIAFTEFFVSRPKRSANSPSSGQSQNGTRETLLRSALAGPTETAVVPNLPHLRGAPI